MRLELVTSSALETRRVAATIASLLRAGDVVVLAGGLGSGKTTFAQGAIGALGVDEPVTSPTFAIVKEYDADVRVAHVDIYRLDRMQELFDLGFEEIVDDDRVTFVEWGDRINGALPAERMTVRLDPTDDPDRRQISVEMTGAGWASRAVTLRDLLAELGD